MPRYIPKDIDYLLSKIDVSIHGCWVWQGQITAKGYPRIQETKPKRHNIAVHRLSYQLFIGGLDKGLTIDHLCSNRACINPDHLEQVTQGVNTLRGRGYTAMKARQTTCIKGHELKTLTTTGHRYCLVCTNARNKIYRAKV